MSKRAKVAAPQWPADVIERRAVGDLKPYPHNSRDHSDEQIDQIIASMRANGWTVPLLIDEQNVIIAGHGRLAAALKIGLKEAPVMVARGWSDDQKRAYRIADNQLALTSSWNNEELSFEMGELSAAGFEMRLTGFPEQMLDVFGFGAEPADTADEWRGMPEYEQNGKVAFRSIHVFFDDQKSVDAFAKLMKQKITPKTKYLWHPEKEITHYDKSGRSK